MNIHINKMLKSCPCYHILILSLRIRGCNLINPHIMIFVTLLSLSLILKNDYMCVCVINVILKEFYHYDNLKVAKTINY